MWALLIAILASAYLLAKISSENQAVKEVKNKGDEWERAVEEWRSRVTDRKLEAELELFVYEHYNKAREKALYFCMYIPEDGMNRENIIRILMAERGKLTQRDATFGINTPFYASPMPVLYRMQKYAEFRKFVAYLKNRLHTKGKISDEMFFEVRYRAKGDEDYYSFHNSKTISTCGTYFWKVQKINTYGLSNKNSCR